MAAIVVKLASSPGSSRSSPGSSRSSPGSSRSLVNKISGYEAHAVWWTVMFVRRPRWTNASGNNHRSIDRSSGPARGGAGRSVAVAPPTGRRVTLIDRSSGAARGGAGRSVAVAPPTERRVTLIDRSNGPARGGAEPSISYPIQLSNLFALL